MKRMLVLLFLGLWISLVGADPQLEVVEPVFDFGTIAQGERVEHQFTLINKGDETLKIRKVKTNCGCTVPTDYPRQISPGGSAELRVIFDSQRKMGCQSRKIYIYSNDTTRDRYVIKMLGTVETDGSGNTLQCNFEEDES